MGSEDINFDFLQKTCRIAVVMLGQTSLALESFQGAHLHQETRSNETQDSSVVHTINHDTHVLSPMFLAAAVSTDC
jgi:hypothetical protein